MRVTCCRKRTGSAALACWLMALLANIFVPGDCSPVGKNWSEEDSSDDPFSPVEPPNGKSGGDENLCLTPECMHTAARVLKNMDINVDPCDDFYGYACGGFLDSTIIPNDKTSSDIFSTMNDELQEQITISIEALGSKDESKPYRLLRNLYKSCMDTDAIDARGLEPLRVVLQKLGGWPVVEGDSWNEDNFNWIDSIPNFRSLGYSFNGFLGLSVEIDLKNSSRRLIVLSQPSLALAREFFVEGHDNKKVSAYFSYMIDMAVMLGAKRDRAEAELEESLKFEMQLANISVPMEQLRDVSAMDNKITLKELQETYPSVPWEEFFNHILPAPLTVEKNETINVKMPSYFAAFEKLISQIPKRIQANYVMWLTVAYSSPYLSSQVRERKSAYRKAIYGITQSPPRGTHCYSTVAYLMDLSIHAIYVRKYFNQGAKKSTVDMVMGIQKQMQRMLQEADWMDEETRDKALEKAAAMASYIAYPDELLDDKNLEEFYQNLELSEHTYFENYLNASLFEMNLSFKVLREPYDKTNWLNHRHAATINAFYSETDNSVQFPAGILQGLFFSNDRPRYMNYGAIGTVIGHEITHAFDDKGRQFDKDGKLADWWGASTKKTYLDRTLCIIEQYGNYSVKGVEKNINGINTQGENIADNGGVKAAYRAYIDWAAGNEPELLLPGLNKTQQQMFWISLANVWCSKTRPEELQDSIVTEVHSPAEFRVLGSVSNMREFAKDFNCPKGSKMNPAKKCTVW